MGSKRQARGEYEAQIRRIMELVRYTPEQQKRRRETLDGYIGKLSVLSAENEHGKRELSLALRRASSHPIMGEAGEDAPTTVSLEGAVYDPEAHEESRERLNTTLGQLSAILLANGYSEKEIQRALRRASNHVLKPNEEMDEADDAKGDDELTITVETAPGSYTGALAGLDDARTRQKAELLHSQRKALIRNPMHPVTPRANS